MNFITPDQFDAAILSPKECSSLIKGCVEDLAVLIAIISGPDATPEKHRLLIRRIAQDLLEGSAVAYERLKDVGSSIIVQ